jgi:hypothetical protein
MELIRNHYGTIKVQRSTNQPISPPVYLYIMEVWVLFVGHGTIEAQFLARQAENPQSKKWLSME